MYFPMDLKYNPTGKSDIDERREEMIAELADEMGSTEGEEDEESFDASPSPELEALLPYYNQVEDEALKVARKYFPGTFVADSKDVHNQKLFEYKLHDHVYRCYVDIYNETPDEINIIEVKATTTSKFTGAEAGLFFSDVAKGKRGGTKYPVFVKEGNIWRLNTAASKVTDDATKNYEAKKGLLLDRFRDEGKYPHDLAFQRFVIEHALREAGDNRRVNYYLAVLNNEYVYDGAEDAGGARVYNEIDGQEIVTFLDMTEITEAYQPFILKEIATLESYISSVHNVSKEVPVGKWCAWGKNTQCVFWEHCYQSLRKVPDYNSANKYLGFRGFKAGSIEDKYQLVNERYYKFDDVPEGWLERENHKIQRDCYDNNEEHVDAEKMRYWFDKIEYPIYHLDFETFPCPLPRFNGENPYRQSVFEFSLHIEREPGVCDKEEDNFIFLNKECYDDERRDLAGAIVKHFEFNEDGTLKGTMLAQNTSFEIGRLKELAALFPEYRDRLLAICDKSADLIHLLKTKESLYSADFEKERAKTINYYHPDLSGSYSIKKTLPVLVPSLTYSTLDVGNGVEAYITYLNYDSPVPVLGLANKTDRRDALKKYCQQDTWAMVEILRAIRSKINIVMAKKTQIIGQAFDKLYADLGNDLSSVLDSKLRNTGNSWKGYGTKWTLDTDSNWFLLEVTPEELDAIWRAADPVTNSIKTHVYHTEYKAKTHEPNSFLLRKEVGINKTDLLNSMLSFFDGIAAGSKLEPYISPEDKDILLRPSRDLECDMPTSSNERRSVTLHPSIYPQPITDQNDDIVIVDYTEPYESFGWRGSIHIEIDLKNKTITSAGWRNGSLPLSEAEAQKYLQFFSNIKNLNDFFNEGIAHDTPIDLRTEHARWYDLKIQWNGKTKAISVGSPDIPFKHPFMRYW